MSRMHSLARGLLRAAAALPLIAALEACGPGCLDNLAGVTCTPPQPTPGPSVAPACIQTSLYTDSGGITSRALLVHDFAVAETGRLDLTLDWTAADSLMGMYLVPAGTCATLDEFNNRTCTFIVRSEPPGTKPRRVSAANIQPGNYRFMVANFSGGMESAAVQIVLSRGSCPAISSAPPTAAQHGATPTVVRIERR